MINPFNLDINETTRFLLPIVFTNTTYEELVANDFKEAYIGMLENPEYDDNSIILKFDYESYSEETLDDMITALDRADLFIKKEDNVIVYSLPEELQEQYDTFLQGKYSEFSDESKQNIVDFWGGLDKASLISDILIGTMTRGVETLLKNMLSSDEIDKMKRHNKTSTDQKTELWKPPNILLDELLFETD